MKSRILKFSTLVGDHEYYRRESLVKFEEERKLARIKENLLKVPTRLQGVGFNDFVTSHSKQTIIKKIAEQFVNTFQNRLQEGTNLLLSGKPGTGKTLLSMAIYHHIVKSVFNVKYESSLRFLKKLQEKNFSSSGDYENAIEYYKNLKLLIIDEVSEGCGKAGYPADWEKNILFEIIDARYQEEVCTIVISNRNVDELTERLGEKTVDRLLHRGRALVFDWDSYRRK